MNFKFILCLLFALIALVKTSPIEKTNELKKRYCGYGVIVKVLNKICRPDEDIKDNQLGTRVSECVKDRSPIKHLDIEEKCCKNHCTIEELKKYCPN